VYGERTASSAVVFEICNISQTLTQPLVLPARREYTVKANHLEGAKDNPYSRQYLAIILCKTD
jgi:hypothetical protein